MGFIYSNILNWLVIMGMNSLLTLPDCRRTTGTLYSWPSSFAAFSFGFLNPLHIEVFVYLKILTYLIIFLDVVQLKASWLPPNDWDTEFVYCHLGSGFSSIYSGGCPSWHFLSAIQWLERCTRVASFLVWPFLLTYPFRYPKPRHIFFSSLGYSSFWSFVLVCS